MADTLVVPYQFADVPNAIAASHSGDTIRVELGAQGFTAGLYGYNFGRGVDFGGRALFRWTSNGQGSLQIDRNAVVTLGSSSTLQFDSSVQWSGTVVVPPRGLASIASSAPLNTEQTSAQLIIGADATMNMVAPSANLAGTVRVGPGASLYQTMTSGTPTQAGTITAEPGSTVSWGTSIAFAGTLSSVGGHIETGPIFTLNQATISLISGTWTGSTISVGSGNTRLNITDSTLIARSLQLTSAGTRLAGSGHWFTDVSAAAESVATYIGDTTIVGAYSNSGTIDVEAGTLTVIGTLINNGRIIGSVNGPRGPGGPVEAISVAGDLRAFAGSSLALPGMALRVTGNFDVAITDSSRLDLSDTDLAVGGAGGSVSLETLSADDGAVESGFSPAADPVKSLSLHGTVRLVDYHPHEGRGRDALYVNQLSIPSDGVLDTNGLHIYYRTLNLAGRVDVRANLIAVPGCSADFNGSGEVTLQDVFDFISAYYSGSQRADINRSGAVTLQDLFDFIDAYTREC